MKGDETTAWQWGKTRSLDARWEEDDKTQVNSNDSNEGENWSKERKQNSQNHFF